MKATVTVTFKNGVLEPQGQAVLGSLHSLGFTGVKQVRVGKLIEMELEDGDKAAARKQIAEMCEELLASPVIENYEISLD